jgi:hypothetical protein
MPILYTPQFVYIAKWNTTCILHIKLVEYPKRGVYNLLKSLFVYWRCGQLVSNGILF